MTSKKRTSASSDDAQLIEALKRGEPAAFRTFIETHQRSVYQICLRMMNHSAEAEDMAQETFIRASQAIANFRGEASLNTWLYRIGINLCKNRLAYLKRRAHKLHDHLPQLEESKGDTWQARARPADTLSKPDEVAEGYEAQRLINAALQLLPEPLKTVLTLRDLEGLSYHEIVEILCIPLGTVKSRLHKARLQLMEHYQNLQNGEGDAGP